MSDEYMYIYCLLKKHVALCFTTYQTFDIYISDVKYTYQT